MVKKGAAYTAYAAADAAAADTAVAYAAHAAYKVASAVISYKGCYSAVCGHCGLCRYSCSSDDVAVMNTRTDAEHANARLNVNAATTYTAAWVVISSVDHTTTIADYGSDVSLKLINERVNYGIGLIEKLYNEGGN